MNAAVAIKASKNELGGRSGQRLGIVPLPLPRSAKRFCNAPFAIIFRTVISGFKTPHCPASAQDVCWILRLISLIKSSL